MRTPSRRLARVAAPALAVPVLLVSMAACGGGDDDASSAPSSPSSSSAPATPSASGSPSAATSLKGTPVDTAEFTALVKRSLDKATTAEIALQLLGSNGTINGTGQVDYTDDSPSLTMKLPGFGNADLRVVGRDVYIKVPAAGMGNTFFKGNLDDPAVAQQLGSLGGFDPASSLQALTEGVDAVSKVGEERIDGDPVTHYAFTADPSGAGAASASPGASDVVVNAWFDADDLLRKTQTTLPDGTKVTLTLSNWGEPVDIKAPPASQVKDLPSAAASQ